MPVPFDQVTWEFVPPVLPLPPAPVLPTWVPPKVTAANWVWQIGPGASTSNPRPLRELTRARGRVVTWRVDGHAVAQFTIDGRADELEELRPLETDLWVWRDNVLMFRGRIGPEVDEIGGTTHQVGFTAVDYRGMCRRRTIGSEPVSFTGTDQAEIAWQLIAATQARPGGNWGITQGLAPAGTPRDRTDPAFKNLLETLEQLANRQGGFEWEISPTMELNIWSPHRGADNGVVLDRGGTIERVTRTLSPDDYGNVVGVLGNDQTVPVEAVTADVATDPRGRWEIVEAFPDVSEQQTLDARAPWLLGESAAMKAPFVAEFASALGSDGDAVEGGRSRWAGRDYLWLGDHAQLRAESGRLATFGVRVVEMQASIGDKKNETWRAGLLEVAE